MSKNAPVPAWSSGRVPPRSGGRASSARRRLPDLLRSASDSLRGRPYRRSHAPSSSPGSGSRRRGPSRWPSQVPRANAERPTEPVAKDRAVGSSLPQSSFGRLEPLTKGHEQPVALRSDQTSRGRERIIDHIQPSIIGMPPDDLCPLSVQGGGLTVRSGAVEVKFRVAALCRCAARCRDC